LREIEPQIFGTSRHLLTVRDRETGDEVCALAYPIHGSDLKAVIEEKTGISKRALRLFVNDKEISEHTWLDRDAEVLLAVRPKESAAFLAALPADPCLASLNVDSSDDFECVIAVVSVKGEELQYASESLKDNEDIVTAAVRNVGMALRHASERVQGLPTVARAAVEQNPFAFKFVKGDAQMDRSVRQLAFMAFHSCSQTDKQDLPTGLPRPPGLDFSLRVLRCCDILVNLPVVIMISMPVILLVEASMHGPVVLTAIIYLLLLIPSVCIWHLLLRFFKWSLWRICIILWSYL